MASHIKYHKCSLLHVHNRPNELFDFCRNKQILFRFVSVTGYV